MIPPSLHGLALFLCLASPAAALEIQARLDTDRILRDGTVRLVLETDGQPEASPDLSPLLRDFRIVHRASSRQIRVINGQRQERHELHLTLSPLRNGQLEIPPIPFGEAATQPIPLEVTAGAEGTAESPTPPAIPFPQAPIPPAALGSPLRGQPQPPLAPTSPWESPYVPPPGLAEPSPSDATPAWMPPPRWDWPPQEVPGPAPFAPATEANPPPPQMSAAPRAARPPAQGSLPLGERPGLFAGLALLVTLVLLALGWRWHRQRAPDTMASDQPSPAATKVPTTAARRPTSPPLTPAIRLAVSQASSRTVKDRDQIPDQNSLQEDQPQVRLQDRCENQIPGRVQEGSLPPADALTRAIAEVQRAYTKGDAITAREALLAWAAQVMPDQPPGNLALLAKRCTEPLRGDILLLEQAFFSPQPLAWDRHRVWEQLPGFAPLPPKEPPIFCQKKKLRRPVPSG